MLLLVFHVKGDQFALDSSNIIEVIPLVKLQSLPMAPDYIAGIFNYRGKSVPVVDLCQYFKKKKYNRYFSTRIILVNLKDRDNYILGLIAEDVNDVIRQDENSFVESGMQLESSPFLGKLVMGENNLIQSIEPQNLITEELADILFTVKEHTD